MSDPAGPMAVWIDLWSQWVEAWMSALSAFGQGVTRGQPIPGVNDARVAVTPAGPVPSTAATAQGSTAQGLFQVTSPVDEDGNTVATAALTLVPGAPAPEGGELWVHVDPPAGTPSGFYSCTVLAPDGSVAAEGVWFYLVQPD